MRVSLLEVDQWVVPETDLALALALSAGDLAGDVIELGEETDRQVRRLARAVASGSSNEAAVQAGPSAVGTSGPAGVGPAVRSFCLATAMTLAWIALRSFV